MNNLSISFTWLSSLLIGLFAIILGACSTTSFRNNINKATPQAQKMKINVLSYGEFFGGLVFSKDNNQICLWESEQYFNDYSPDKWVIFSTHDGKYVTSWANELKQSEELLQNFPFLEPVVKWAHCFTNETTYINPTAYILDKTSTYAVRANPNNSPAPNVELLRLGETPSVIWGSEVNNSHHVRQFAFLNNEKQILAACSGITGYILETKSGEILSSFNYGPIDTPEKIKARKRRFALWVNGDDFNFNFDGKNLSIDPFNRYLAVSGWYDRRVRIISLSNFSMLHEFNADENPFWPFGGQWEVRDLHFSPSGNYLIVESAHDGRLSLGRRITEIIDTKNWKIVKKITNSGIYSVTLSSDDRQMAFIQNNVLVIQPFILPKK